MTTTPRPPQLATEYVEPPRLVDLLPAYERYLVGEQRRPQGIALYVWMIRRCLTWLGPDATMADLNTTAVRRYKEELGERCKSSTVINMLAVIRDFSLWATAEGLRSDDPTAGVKRPPKRRPAPNPLYQDEITTVMRAIEAGRPKEGSQAFWYWRRNRLCVVIALMTGMRIGEISRLTWSHINMRERIIQIYDSKNGKDRALPCHSSLLAELEAVPSRERLPGRAVIGAVGGKTMDRKRIAKIFSEWLRDLLNTFTGDPTFHVWAHRCRATWASHMCWAEVDLITIQELLGHNQLETVRFYAATNPARKRAAIDKLPDLLAGSREDTPNDHD